jgi:hypothetical protein
MDYKPLEMAGDFPDIRIELWLSFIGNRCYAWVFKVVFSFRFLHQNLCKYLFFPPVHAKKT